MPENSEKENHFLMPAEWEKHSAVWLAWPIDKDFYGERLEGVEKVYIQIISLLHKDEIVKLLVLNEEEEGRISGILKNSGIDLSRIIFFHADYQDIWVRDYGPTFVKKGSELSYIKWRYDGYGEKFPELFKDNEVFLSLKDKVSGNMIEAKIPVEGGAIDANGLGTFLTTRECLIESRNIGKSPEEIENLLREFVGATKLIWLNKGLVNDHTDGHIDEVARFVGPSKILCAYEDDSRDENFERLSENFKVLEEATDQAGKKFEVIKLPMPHMNYEDGTKAPVSYANFYIGNNTVLASIFSDENDEKALSVLQSCFPNKRVVGIDCRDLIYGGGALHCITQQEPA